METTLFFEKAFLLYNNKEYNINVDFALKLQDNNIIKIYGLIPNWLLAQEQSKKYINDLNNRSFIVLKKIFSHNSIYIEIGLI